MKPYAVVSFINDGSAEFESASEIPSSWLTSNLKQCWWPNTKNVGSLITRKTLPDKTSANKWQLHDVEFIGFYGKLAENLIIFIKSLTYSIPYYISMYQCVFLLTINLLLYPVML